MWRAEARAHDSWVRLRATLNPEEPLGLVCSLWLSNSAYGAPTKERDLDNEAGRLHQEGVRLLDERNYIEALRAFTSSLEKTRNDPSRGPLSLRARWGRVKAYRGLDNICAAREDLDVLKSAKLPPAITSKEGPELERAQQEAEGCETRVPADETPNEDPASGGPPDLTPARPDPTPVRPPPEEVPPPPPPPPPRPLRSWGVGIAVFGGMSLAVMTGMLGGGASLEKKFQDPDSDRAEVRHKGFLYNDFAAAAGVIGGIAAVTGVVLITIDERRHRRKNLAAIPLVDRRAAGLSVHLAF